MHVPVIFVGFLQVLSLPLKLLWYPGVVLEKGAPANPLILSLIPDILLRQVLVIFLKPSTYLRKSIISIMNKLYEKPGHETESKDTNRRQKCPSKSV